MRFLFTILSIVYIAGIFFFADSSVVSDLSSFNPYSLLHIPLYGVLTFLLIFSFLPSEFKGFPKLSNDPNDPNDINVPNDPTNQRNQRNQSFRFFIPDLIASVVAITDEIHQAYVPGRDASLTDVLLDFVGITLVLFFVIYLFRKRQSLKTQLTQ